MNSWFLFVAKRLLHVKWAEGSREYGRTNLFTESQRLYKIRKGTVMSESPCISGSCCMLNSKLHSNNKRYIAGSCLYGYSF